MTGSLHNIAVPGGILAADESGTGPPILLIHSATVDRRSWDDVVPRLVAAGYRAIRYDMRGFGESTTDEVDFAGERDLLAVMDAMDLGKVAVVGNSMGAIFALDAILEAPDRFVEFSWVGGGIGGFNRSETPEEAAAFAALAAAHEGDDLDAVTEWNIRIWFDGVGQPSTRVAPALREQVRAMNRPLMEKGRVFGNLQRPDPPAVTRLSELKLPIFALVGELDTSGTKEAAQLLATTAHAKFLSLPAVAHLPGIEVPDRIAELIIEQVQVLPAWH